MPLPTLITWLTADDYDAIKRLAPNDPNLPETYGVLAGPVLAGPALAGPVFLEAICYGYRNIT